MLTPRSLAQIPQRYSFASFGDEAVLLDLETGGYFMLNRTAELICRILFEEQRREDAERRVSSQFGIRASEARAAIDEMARQLSTAPIRGSYAGPFTYLPTGNGYNLCYDEVPVLGIRSDGLSAERFPAAVSQITLAHALRVAVPKLMSLRGLTVLHASSCHVGTGLTAFCGLSGAGKTTTARAFAAAGMDLFSEDLIVLAPEPPNSEVRALLGAEAAAHAWARDTGARAMGRAETEIDCGDLPGLVVGVRNAIPLTRIIFVDANRRSGDAIQLTRLRPAEALVHVMTSNFLGSADWRAWEAYFQRSSKVAQSVTADLAIMPNGTEALALAASRYRANSAS